MKARIALVLAVSAIGFVLGTASPAMAMAPFGYAHYNAEDEYVGCTSAASGAFYYPNEITEYGCTN